MGSDPVRDCEDALVAQWGQFGSLPGGSLHSEDGITWFETQVPRLPYNGVPSTRASDPAAIERLVERFRARGVDFWWVHHPSAQPSDLGARLVACGLAPVEDMHFMWMDLDAYEPAPPPDGVEIERVADPASVEDYIDLTLLYWEVPDDAAEGVRELHRAISPEDFPGRRYVARIDGEAIGKAYLSWPGPDGVCGIYGMSVRTSARGRGIAAAMSAAMMSDARALGLRRAVLHSTEMAVGVYRRIGFEQCAVATVYATAELWSKED